MPPPLAGWAAALDLAAVDDALAMRARQLLLRASQLSPTALGQLQRGVAQDLVARVGPPPDRTPDWAVLAAVVAERRRRALSGPGPQQPAQPPAHRPQPAPVSPVQPPTAPTTDGGFAPPG
jgi:hypothetical protein